MTKQQWIADEGRQNAFRALINEPVMQEALALVRAECTPKAREAEDASHITTLYALDHSKAIGWFGALSMLEALQDMTPRLKKADAKPWNHKEELTTK